MELKRCGSLPEVVNIVCACTGISAEWFCRCSCCLVQSGRSWRGGCRRGCWWNHGLWDVFKPHGKLGWLWSYWGLVKSRPESPESAHCLVALAAGSWEQVSCLTNVLFPLPVHCMEWRWCGGIWAGPSIRAYPAASCTILLLCLYELPLLMHPQKSEFLPLLFRAPTNRLLTCSDCCFPHDSAGWSLALPSPASSSIPRQQPGRVREEAPGCPGFLPASCRACLPQCSPLWFPPQACFSLPSPGWFFLSKTIKPQVCLP